ncbi:RhoGAP domain containing protein [Histomonas meleagridis]|uniref:RhoGAP domain containing protein n=1 Tax=Histomonas meleagridis TaxID=135588 RepID=UPI00355A3A09|nr:RhoGAP domain containing protein [Histomonas meleagridis]KAH0796242.1 RhoGAP domain containing protein [Histomonas meleagridis]
MSTFDYPQYFTRSPEEFGGKIPFIVTDLIERMRELNAESVEGIFRLSGPTGEVDNLCSRLDNGRADLSHITDVHILSCALKKYFRDIVEIDPLLPFEYFDDVIAIPEMQNVEEGIQKFKSLLKNLTSVRLQTFAYLFKYLKDITQNPTSKMNSTNLAIVFSPNIMASKKKVKNYEKQIKINGMQNKAIAMLIDQSDKIFEGVELSPFITAEDMVILSSPPINKNDVQYFIETRKLRHKSLIPFVPFQLLGSPNFVRPNRAVTLRLDE